MLNYTSASSKQLAEGLAAELAKSHGVKTLAAVSLLANLRSKVARDPIRIVNPQLRLLLVSRSTAHARLCSQV